MVVRPDDRNAPDNDGIRLAGTSQASLVHVPGAVEVMGNDLRVWVVNTSAYLVNTNRFALDKFAR